MALRELYEELPSTQDRAIALAREGAEDGTVVVARRQTAGRGRGDRRWASAPGGLYLSIVLRPAPGTGALALAIGEELAGAFAEEFGLRVRVKWPNDLVVVDAAGGVRKLAGVLLDVLEAGAVVAGIGVNVAPLAPSAPADVRARAVALEGLLRGPVSLDRLEAVVSRAVRDARLALAAPNGRSAVLARVRGLLYGVGEPVTVDGVDHGTMMGLADDGAMAVRSAEGMRTVRAGDVAVGASA